MAHVQTYGVVAQAERDAGDFADTHEASALLGTHATPKVVHKRDGRASLASSVSNLLNTIMGTGAFGYMFDYLISTKAYICRNSCIPYGLSFLCLVMSSIV